MFLAAPLAPEYGLGLYIAMGDGGWAFRGYVASSHPSDVFPMQARPAEEDKERFLHSRASLRLIRVDEDQPACMAGVHVGCMAMSRLLGSKAPAQQDLQEKMYGYDVYNL